jgi:hypothetical protein
MVTLLEHTIGILHGDTNTGGTHNTGVFYSPKPACHPTPRYFRPSGKVGKSIGILGQGFNSATGVSFNGTASKFTIASDPSSPLRCQRTRPRAW